MPTHIEILMPDYILNDQKGQDLSGIVLPENDEELLDCVSAISILDGIKEKVSQNTEIHYAQGCDFLDSSKEGFSEAVKAARNAEVVVMVLGGRSGLIEKCASGENIEPNVYPVQAAAGTGEINYC